MNEAVVALGSNIDPDVHIRTAVDRLGQDFMLLSQSAFVRTVPLGIKEQAEFINGVVLVRTSLSRPEFSRRLKEMEVTLGRKKRDEKWGPREIDLDLLIWDGKVVNDDFYSREFLRAAVLEVLPGFC